MRDDRAGELKDYQRASNVNEIGKKPKRSAQNWVILARFARLATVTTEPGWTSRVPKFEMQTTDISRRNTELVLSLQNLETCKYMQFEFVYLTRVLKAAVKANCKNTKENTSNLNIPYETYSCGLNLLVFSYSVNIWFPCMQC